MCKPKPFPCEQCDRSYFLKSTLNKHVNSVHKKLKPHSCNLCEKKFFTRGCRDKHINTHLKETLYKCNICERSFGWEISLKLHMEKLHGKSKVKKFLCTRCPLVFLSNFELLGHYLKKHVGSRDDPLQCFLCEFKGSTVTKLEN